MENLTIRTNNLVKALEKKGYNATATTTDKNGTIQHAVIIRENDNDTISPVIYVNDIVSANATLESKANKVIEIYNANKNDREKASEDFSNVADLLKDVDFVLNNLYIALEPLHECDYITRLYEHASDIQKYMYVRLSDNASVKLTSNILEYSNISHSRAWDVALANTCKDINVNKLFNIILGADYDNDLSDSNPYVLSNTNRIKGASAILNENFLEKYATAQGVEKIAVLPSSIHEVLVMPYNDNVDLSDLNEMVTNINLTEVDECERLSDNAWIIDLSDRFELPFI